MFNFEKLDTWHEAIAFADLVYQFTRNFPADERFGLTNQMRRAAVSISSNIAEGSSRSSRQDYVRFLEIATGSLFEVVSQATIGRHQRFLTTAEYDQLYQAAEKQSRMLGGQSSAFGGSHQNKWSRSFQRRGRVRSFTTTRWRSLIRASRAYIRP